MASLIGINELKDITQVLSEKTGFPFSDLSLSFLKRRINSFCEKNRIRSASQFSEQLSNSLFVDSLMYEIPVDCTEMFRDPGFWRTLYNKVLPKITESGLPIWFPDASSGEELYSFLIMRHLYGANAKSQVFYNHPSTKKLTEISAGLLVIKDIELAESNFKRLEINASIWDSIDKQNNPATLNASLLDNTKGKGGWIMNRPGNQQLFSLIVLRNSMLYINKPLQDKLGALLFEQLAPGGFLAIGIKENLPEALFDKLDVVDSQERIYKKPGILNGVSL